MDIFEVHRRIKGDYADYIRIFDSISDDVMRQRVAPHLGDGRFGPKQSLCADRASARTVTRFVRCLSPGAEMLLRSNLLPWTF